MSAGNDTPRYVIGRASDGTYGIIDTERDLISAPYATREEAEQYVQSLVAAALAGYIPPTGATDERPEQPPRV